MNRRLYGYSSAGFRGLPRPLLITEDNVWLAYGMMVVAGSSCEAYAGPFWTLPPL